MREAKRVVRNSGFMFMTNLFSKILTMIIVIVLARYLGVEDYGKFSFVLGFTGLFAVFGNLGLTLLLNRMVSRDRKKVNFYFSNALFLSALLNFATFIIIMVFAFILRYDGFTVKLIMLGGLFIIFQNIKTPFQAVFEAFESMHFVFWSRSAKIVLRLGLIMFFVFMGKGLWEVLFVYAFAEFVMIFVDLWLYNRKIAKLKFEVQTGVWSGMLKSALPFGIAGIFMVVYDKIDVTMISKMVSNPDVAIGFYSSAYEIMSGTMFIAISISAALAPVAYRAFVKSREKLIKIYQDSFRLLLVLSVPISVGGFVLAEQIINFVYGPEYHGSVVALKVLIWAVIFNFEMFAFGLALNSMNLEKETMKATIYSVIFNVVANFILIPLYGYVAAAYTTVGSVLIYFVYCLYVTNKNLVKINLVKMLAPVVLSSLVMAVFLFFIRGSVHVLLSIILGFAVYSVVIFLSGSVDRRLIDFFREVIRKRRL